VETSGDLHQYQSRAEECRGDQWGPPAAPVPEQKSAVEASGTSTITRSSQQEQGPQLEQEWELQGQPQ